MTLPDLRPGLTRSPFYLISGPCVIESRELAFEVATTLKSITADLDIPFVFKASFDKANRTSGVSFRGLGRTQGLEILGEIRESLKVPVLTDVHSLADVDAAKNVVDYLQIPAFLCRQTDLVQAAASSGLPVNIKKGQFLSPEEMTQVVNKAHAAQPDAVITVCERGVSFGYHNLVVDMRSLEIMRQTGCAVVFDSTHSVQLPGAGGDRSSGQRQYIPLLARAAVAVGIDGLFMETHPRPEEALSDGPNAWPLKHMKELLTALVALDKLAKRDAIISFTDL